jgi:hypothetical protein
MEMSGITPGLDASAAYQPGGRASNLPRTNKDPATINRTPAAVPGKATNGRVNSNPVNGTGKYSHLKEPRKVGPGRVTTPAQRKRILEENKKQNGGQLTSDESGKPLNPPSQSKSGQPADMDQAEVDHVDPRSKGGSNSNANQRVISKRENLAKSDN